MTPQEAIKHLKSVHRMYDVMCGDWSFCWTAIEALEKQIAKKPILKQDIGICIMGEEIKEHKSTNWHCPICDWFVGEQIVVSGKRLHNQNKKNFCDRCGTKIDWSDNK